MTLLLTKLNIPRTFSDLLERPRLTARLNEGAQNKLVLVSAPAGFGKTTLLSSWAVKAASPVAWLSLDEHDDDPVRFWSYFVAALQTIPSDNAKGNNLGDTAIQMLQSQQAPPIESVLTELVNDIANFSPDFVLVLDDYHNISDKSIHEGLAFLVDHLPAQAHLVLASRVDPPLPLPRWRVRHHLVQLGTEDIRFTHDEAEAFLNLVMGLTLATDDIDTLQNLTEGWVAALKLAAISMQGSGDTTAFIKSFAGNNRYVFDYLAQEVLNRQPEEIRHFLLQTSILERLSCSLCDAVTNGQRSQEILEKLEQSRLFVVPLDQRREWYRYFRLFADFLRIQLRHSSGPSAVAGLHRRASLWYEQHELAEDAINHAVEARDYELAVRLVKNAALIMFPNGEIITLLKWLNALPEEIVRKDGGLSLHFAWALLATGQADASEARLKDVEQAFGVKAEDWEKTEISTILRLNIGQVLCIRANIAYHRNDFVNAIKFSKMANSCLSADLDKDYAQPQRAFLGATKFNLGLAYEITGDLLSAANAFEETITLEKESPSPHLISLANNHLAQIQIIQGHLNRADEIYKQTLQSLGDSPHPTPLLGMIRTGIGNILCERNDLDNALEYITRGIELGKIWNNWETLQPGYFGLARIEAARGDLDAAIESIKRLDNIGTQLKIPGSATFVGVYRTRLLLRKGNISEAERWLETTVLDLNAEPPYLREPEAIAQAYVLAALGKMGDSMRLSDLLLESTRYHQRWGRFIEILVLRAITLQRMGNTEQAIDDIARALKLAGNEHYVRIFLDEGQPMTELLNMTVAKGVMVAYSQNLLSELKAPHTETAQGKAVSLEAKRRNRTLAEPLSEREFEVLQLLGRGLTNQEIAQKLFVSQNTIKTHVKNIHTKLATRNRTEATTRAQELGLLQK